MQLILLGVGTKVSPRDNGLVSEFESRTCTVKRLITVSSSCSGCDMVLFWERVLRLFLCWLMFVGVLGVELAVFLLGGSKGAVVTLSTVLVFSAFYSALYIDVGFFAAG